VRAAVTAAACALVALAAGCGGDDDSDEPDRPAAVEADLVVTVWPEGPEGRQPERRRIRCERLGEGTRQCRGLKGLQPEQFEPVPGDVACPEIYGGPATARVRGELRGTPVNARFNRIDGCQIERWERNRALLGDAVSIPRWPAAGHRRPPARRL
jgi:hypothetical protein